MQSTPSFSAIPKLQPLVPSVSLPIVPAGGPGSRGGLPLRQRHHRGSWPCDCGGGYCCCCCYWPVTTAVSTTVTTAVTATVTTVISVTVPVNTIIASIIRAPVTTDISFDGGPGAEEGASVAVFPVGVMDA